MKGDIRIGYNIGNYVELPAPVSVKSESGPKKWIGGAFNRQQRKTNKGGINGIKSSSVQPFNINGNVLVTNSGIWNYLKQSDYDDKTSKEDGLDDRSKAYLQKIPMLDISNSKEQPSKEKSDNDNSKAKNCSPGDEAMRDVLQAKLFKLQFEAEVYQIHLKIYSKLDYQ